MDWKDCEIINEHILKKNYDVVVYCRTYNFGKYISEAIEGFIMQKTSYSFFVMIFDDCSTDDSQAIIRDYAQKNSDLICACLGKTNIYRDKELTTKVWKWLCDKFFVAKYIAQCEGDDYWIDSNKLQTQVDFLEKNPGYSLTIHSANKYDYRNDKHELMKPFEEGDVRVDELIMETSCIIPTASTVALKDVVTMEGFPQGPASDKRMWLNALRYGKIYYFDKVMSTYRYYHSESWTRKVESTSQNRVLLYSEFADFYLRSCLVLDEKYRDLMIKKAKKFSYFSIYNENLLDTDLDQLYVNRKYEYINYIGDIMREQKRVQRYIKELHYIDDELYDFCTKNINNIYIYGNGDYGRKMLTKLENKGISVKGFVISGGPKDRVNGVETYYLGEIEESAAGIIVSVSDQYEQAIKDNLNNAGISNWKAPFWVDFERLIMALN